MKSYATQEAVAFLQALINQPLCYGLKSPDLDLYDFGFGKLIEARNCKKVCAYTLHVTCRFKIIKKFRECQVDRYYEDTPCEKFHSEIKRLIGLRIKRISLSDKNDLWLDFGTYWVVFATFENGEESWRFFTFDTNSTHLVASDSWLDFSRDKRGQGDGSAVPSQENEINPN